MMVEEPDSENSLFSEPMKIRTPSARSARPSRSITPRLVSRSSNNSRTRSRSSSACRSSSRLAWPRTISWRSSLVAAGPARDPRRDHLLRQLIELGAALRQRLFKFEPRFGERAAADSRIEEIRGLRQRRGRHARRQSQHAVFDLAILGDQHDQRPLRLEPHELDVLEARHWLWRSAPPLRCGSGPTAASAPRPALPRPIAPGRPDAAALWIDCRSGSVRSPTCISASTKNRKPSSVGSRPAEVCGA